MDNIDWDQAIEEGLAAIPLKFREKIRNVALLIEDDVSDDVRRQEGLDEHETLLGYYHGIPLSERGDFYGVGPTMPDTITLYKQPILDEADHDPARVRQVVIDTIWHEFGHYFGLDEYEVRKREKQREGGRV